MERIRTRNDDVAVGLPQAERALARELDRGFVRFGSRITEEDAIESGDFGELVGELAGRFVMIEVAAVHERRGLRRDRADDGRMRMTERAHRDPRDEIEITVATLIDQPNAFAAHEIDRRAIVVLHEMRMLDRGKRAAAGMRDHVR